MIHLTSIYFELVFFVSLLRLVLSTDTGRSVPERQKGGRCMYNDIGPSGDQMKT